MDTTTETAADQGNARPPSRPEAATVRGVAKRPTTQKGDNAAAGQPAKLRSASDDEILGIEASGQARRDQDAFDWEAEASGKESGSSADQTNAAQLKGEIPELEAALAANPELRRAWDDARAYRETFRTPAEARSATAALADLARMDALFFSGRADDHAELARVVASLDPAAFRSLARAMSEVAKEGQGSSDAAVANPVPSPRAELSTGTANAQQHGVNASANTSSSEASGVAANPKEAAARAETRGLTPQQEEFFHSTNATAVRAVLDSIEQQVEKLLPAEISKGARNRLVGEIYRELDASLRGDRQFASQAREAFRSGGLDDEHRQAIVAMVNSRARQALPGVARRVLNEWTSAIVAANQDGRARQRAAERRVDIAGSGRSGNDGLRPVTPKDINYSRMSDADILNL